jgi:hypothetical protein
VWVRIIINIEGELAKALAKFAKEKELIRSEAVIQCIAGWLTGVGEPVSSKAIGTKEIVSKKLMAQALLNLDRLGDEPEEPVQQEPHTHPLPEKVISVRDAIDLWIVYWDTDTRFPVMFQGAYRWMLYSSGWFGKTPLESLAYAITSLTPLEALELIIQPCESVAKFHESMKPIGTRLSWE